MSMFDTLFLRALRWKPLLYRLLAFLRQPVVAVLFGIVMPIVTFGMFGPGVAAMMGIVGPVESWFAPSRNLFIITQQLFVGISVAILLSWLVFRRPSVMYFVLLCTCAGTAALLGMLTLSLAMIGLVIDPSRLPFLLPSVTPWLAASTYGACAWDAYDLKRSAAPLGLALLWAFPLLAIAFIMVIPFAVLWLLFVVGTIQTGE